MNQGKLEQALTLLTQADALYAPEVPEDALKAKPPPAGGGHFGVQPRRGDQFAGARPGLADRPAGAVGAARADRGAPQPRRGAARARQAGGSGRCCCSRRATWRGATDWRGRSSTPGCIRTTALTAAAQGQDSQALADLQQSTTAFDRALPGSKPLAETYLLHARELLRAGRGADALPICHGAVTALAALKAGTTPDLMAPCLDIYAAAADQQKDQAPGAAGRDVHRGAARAGRHHQPADRPGQRDAGGERARSRRSAKRSACNAT